MLLTALISLDFLSKAQAVFGFMAYAKKVKDTFVGDDDDAKTVGHHKHSGNAEGKRVSRDRSSGDAGPDRSDADSRDSVSAQARDALIRKGNDPDMIAEEAVAMEGVMSVAMGQIIAANRQYAAQSTGRGAYVVHRQDDLARPVDVGEMVSIAPRDGTVQTIAPRGPERSHALDTPAASE